METSNLISDRESFVSLIGALRDCGKDGLDTQHRLDLAQSILQSSHSPKTLKDARQPLHDVFKKNSRKRQLKITAGKSANRLEEEWPVQKGFGSLRASTQGPAKSKTAFTAATSSDALDLLEELNESWNDERFEDSRRLLSSGSGSKLPPLDRLNEDLTRCLNLGHRSQTFLQQIMQQDLSQLYITLDFQKKKLPVSTAPAILSHKKTRARKRSDFTPAQSQDGFLDSRLLQAQCKPQTNLQTHTAFPGGTVKDAIEPAFHEARRPNMKHVDIRLKKKKRLQSFTEKTRSFWLLQESGRLSFPTQTPFLIKLSISM